MSHYWRTFIAISAGFFFCMSGTFIGPHFWADWYKWLPLGVVGRVLMEYYAKLSSVSQS